jgi:DNA polymerase
MSWLRGKNFELPDVSRETVTRALTEEPPADVRRVLELRQMAAKSSVAKLERMLDVASTNDGRARNLLQFYGAGRTGRWAGRLIQPQNLPRTPKGFRPEAVINAACIDLAAPGLLWGDAMDAISKCLRSCFIAKQGCVLVSVDLSQIEARVLAWLAGQQDIVQAFRQGQDVYTMQAYKVGSRDRQLGKVLTLACGFGMGARKFWETACGAPYNLVLTFDEAVYHLASWRRANPDIIGYWKTVEDAVRLSISNVDKIVNLTGTMAVRTRHGVTQVRKPNGVKLTYHNMRLENGGLVFDGVNGVTKQWGTERTYGGRLVENIVQSVARDVMAEGMLSSSHQPVMTVHDEIIWEVPGDDAVLATFSPPWASGLPVASETTVGRRYAK